MELTLHSITIAGSELSVPYRDPEQRRAYNRAYQKKYYAKNRSKRKQDVRKRRKELRVWYNEIRKETECADCGMSGEVCSWLMEYHHLPGHEKVSSVSFLVNNGYSKERILEEMDKCEVLCANCHRVRHFEEAKFAEHGAKPAIDLDTVESGIAREHKRARRAKHRKERKQTAERHDKTRGQWEDGEPYRRPGPKSETSE